MVAFMNETDMQARGIARVQAAENVV